MLVEVIVSILPKRLPRSLKMLDCKFNFLTSLPRHLPNTITQLNCKTNELMYLPEKLPESLKYLYCDDNNIKSLPLTLLNCKYLNTLRCENNPIENIHPRIYNFLGNQKIGIISVYGDTQSVHNHNIQESVKNSIINIFKDTYEEISLYHIINDDILTEQTKTILLEYYNDPTQHSVLLITFSELLNLVWIRIVKHKDCNEIKKILNEEMTSSICKCFTGRLSRLINCLNGFYDDIQIKIGSNEQIGNIISIIQKNLGNNYTITRHKEEVKKELIDRSYSDDIIEEWLSYIG